MGVVSRFAGKISLVLDQLARWTVVALMLLVVANVVLRLFGHPITGTVEWAEFLTAVAIGLSLAYCGHQGGHIAVTFLVEKLHRRLQAIIYSVMDLAVLVFLSVAFWRIILYANDMKLNGRVSLTTGAPYYLFIYVVAAGFLAYCLVVLGSLIPAIGKIFGKQVENGQKPGEDSFDSRRVVDM